MGEYKYKIEFEFALDKPLGNCCDCPIFEEDRSLCPSQVLVDRCALKEAQDAELVVDTNAIVRHLLGLDAKFGEEGEDE